MKIFKYLSLVLVVALTVSCQKHEIQYNSTPISDLAEFQIHYVVPVTAAAAFNITKIEVNGMLYANIKAPITTYNAVPNGSVGRFFTVTPGTVNIKLYRGALGDTLKYDQDVTLVKGKQNIFVHDYTKPPIVFDNGFPYTKNLTGNTDSSCYVKFYHFLYETAGVPCALKLQYQYIDPRNTALLINIGPPVSFGETTGWQPVKVVKSIFNSTGYARVDFRIKIIDANGNVVGDLQARNTSGATVSYADYWTEYIGRRYHHTLSGIRTTSPGTAVRVFTAL
jgi:hypothetical protein